MPDNDPIEEAKRAEKPPLSAEQQEQAAQLQERLAIHRRTLRHYLDQEASLGEAYTPPSVSNGIHETREDIRNIKTLLGEWGVVVENYPDDEELPSSVQAGVLGDRSLRYSPLLIITSVGTVVLAIFLGLLFLNQQRSPTAFSLPPTATPFLPTAVPTVQPTPTEIPPVAPVAQGKYMVLVSQLALQGDNQQDTTQAIVQNLKNVFEQDLPQSELQVRFYPGVIRSYEQAVEVADENKAAVVVWGSSSVSSTNVTIQVGSLAPFPGYKIGRNVMDRTANINVNMTSDEQMSIAPHVVVVLQVIQTSAGEGFSIVRNTDIIDQMINQLTLVSPLIETNNVAGRFHRGLLLHFGKPAEAVAEYDAAIKQDSTNPLLYLLRGTALGRLGEFDRAAQDVATSTRLEPTRTWASPLYLQIIASVFRSDYMGGVSAADQILQQQPQDWLATYARGGFYYFLQDYANARIDLEHAIDLGPESSLPYQTLALVDLHEGNIANAQQLLATAQQKFPDPETANRLLYGLVGAQPNIFGSLLGSLNALSFGRPSDVFDHAQQGLQLRPGDPDLLMLQGIAHCVLKQYPEAEASYSQAIDNAPSFTLLRLLRAESRLRQQNVAGVGEDVAFIQQDPNAAAFVPYLEAFQQGEFTCETLLAS